MVLGCTLVDGCSVLQPVGLAAEDDGFIQDTVAWHEIHSAGEDFGLRPPVELRDRVVTVSRWFGHHLEITQRD